MFLKKAAMFGLFRALKKQSGGLFLARRHSEGSKETSGSFKTTRAAMFGLDARIALAIFGALSVISGAALYSAIQESKLLSTFTGLQEIIKAHEALYLDTGTLRTASDKSMYEATDLVTDNSLAGWSGPYITGTANTSNGNIFLDTPNKPKDYNLRIRNVRTSDWKPEDLWGAIVCPSSNDICTTALQLRIGASTDILGSQLDTRFDDGDQSKGRIRYGATDSNNFYIYIFGFNHNSI